MNATSDWKCPNCGASINPGDQICRNCGSTIHNTNVTIADLRSYEHGINPITKKNRFFLLFSILAVILGIAVIFCVLWFGFLKR